MTSSRFSVRAVRRRVRICLVMLLSASLAAIVLAAVGTGQATASANGVHAGRGYRMSSGDFVGYYVTARGQKIYCLSPRKGVPRSVSLHTVSRYGGLSAATSAALSYAISSWGDARTKFQAAVESQVLNTLAGNRSDVARRAGHLPRGVRATVSSHVAQARAERGPYRVQLHLGSAVTPGRSGTGQARVRTGGGHWLHGATVRLSHSANVSLPRSVRTDAHGVARFTYRVTDVGEVSVAATVSGLAPTRLQASSPRAGEQHMVHWQARVSARATARFRAVPSGFTNSYTCSATCDGHPQVHLRACAAASKVASRMVYRVGSHTVTVGFAAASKRTCTTTTVAAADRDRISAAWQYRTAHGWSKPVAAAGTLTVDCPAVPALGVTMTYDCSGASVTIGLATKNADGTWTPAVNTSAHREVLVVGGARTASVTAAHGGTAVYRTTAVCGAKQTITARAGVQRTNGTWNYGPVSSITTP